MQSLTAQSQLSENQFYLTIYLTDQTVQAALWRIKNAQLEITETSDTHTYLDEKSCLIETDKALQELGSDSEGVNETVFGFEPDWIDKDGIIDARKPLLKKLTESLSLKPIGFVTSTESVVQEALTQDPLLSMILIELRSKQLKISILQRGTLIGTHVVGRSGDPVADITEGLARFEKDLGEDHLPSKITLYSNQLAKEELDEHQQQLLAQNWTEDKPFLHQPEITVEPVTYLLDVMTRHAAPSTGGVVVPQENSEAKQLSDEGMANEFGFTSATDGEDQPNHGEPTTAVIHKSEEVKSFGIPIKMPFSPTKPEKESPMIDDTPPEGLEGVDTNAQKKSPFGFFKKLSSNKKQPKSHIPFVGAGFLGGMLILLGLGTIFAQTNYKTIVTLEPATENISKETKIILDPDISQADVEKGLLPANLRSVDVQGEDSLNTTGVTLVGDKATGTVTIFNKTTSEKSFAAGTRLSAGDQTFTINQEITVPAASVSENDNGDGETKTYGKADVAATAEEIGAESNIEANTDLTIASFDIDTYSAAATEAFTGGSSREVRVVSDDDIATLKKQLTNALSSQAEEKLQSEAATGEYLIPTGNTEVVSANFDAEVGDEVQSVSLNLSLTASAYVYKNEDLKPLAVALLSSEVPDGYKLSEQDPQILSTPSDSADESGRVELEANVSSKAVPSINQDQLINELLGLTYGEAISKLQSNPVVRMAEIHVEPTVLKNIFSTMPKKADRIELKVEEK